VYRRKTREGKRRRESGEYPFHLFQAFHGGDDMKDDAFACAETECRYLDADTLEGCKKRACPFTYQRHREEDQAERDRKDGKVKDET
jgi:hypothetical protein